MGDIWASWLKPGAVAWCTLSLLVTGAFLQPARAEAEDLNQFGSWVVGRATKFGDDAWSIHDGGCNYGHLYAGEPVGWDVAAMTDVDPLYRKQVCGFCLEVKCNPSAFKDGYGSWLDRTQACWDPSGSASRVVRIVDTCPCTYAQNAASNKRWCCGDMPHLDLSYITFGGLADPKWGVIGIQYRQVPCSYRPSNQASISDYTSQDRMYYPGMRLPFRDWPEYMTSQPSTAIVWGDSGYGPGWVDASWNTYVVPQWQSQSSGMYGTPGICAKVQVGGALAFWTSNNNMFAGRRKLSFWMYVGVTGYAGRDAKVADITISLSGYKGSCSNPRIWYVKPTQFAPSCTYCTDYWWFWEFDMNGFSGGDPNSPNSPYNWNGCGGNGVQDLTRIEFRNEGYGGGGDKYFCLDSIQLR